MSERGVYAVDRGVWDHECFADEPFTEREAWMWLCGAASWKPQRRRIGAIDVVLERGQLAASLRFLGERFQWGKNKVARFFDRLEKRDMIRTAIGTGLTVITICNYDQYQKVSLPSGTASGTESGTATGQQRDKVESIKNNQEDSEAKASAAVAAPVFADSTHELWHEGVTILGQLGLPDKPARSNIGRWLRDAKSDAAKVLGAIQRARDARTRDPVAFVTGALRTNLKPRGKSGFLDLALEIGNEHSDYPKPRLIGSGS
jgi:hypothetical protein